MSFKACNIFYSSFLDNTLTHSSKYSRIFEKQNLDVSSVYNLMIDYCEFYINRLRKFESLSLSTAQILRTISSGEFQRNYMMNFEEYIKKTLSNVFLFSAIH